MKASDAELQETLTRWDEARADFLATFSENGDPAWANIAKMKPIEARLSWAGDALRSLLARGEQSGTSAEAQPASSNAAHISALVELTQPEPTPANSPALPPLDRKEEA